MCAARINNNITILTYHSIDNSGSAISVSPSTFKKHMTYLKGLGYKTLLLREVVRYVKHGVSFPKKTIAITFDDGYRNNYTHALPLLEKYNFAATIFLTTQHCGGLNNWPDQHPSIPQLEMLSWKEIKELKKYGIEVGAHTRHHPRLSELDRKEALDEILGSKTDIEAHLGRPVEVFSYPFGRFTEQTRNLVRSFFRGAISNRPGKVSWSSDVYALERINATSQLFKSLPIQFSFFNSFEFYLLLKRLLDKSKYVQSIKARRY
jgi:peptidoglycan/xylan/chitin deacetylase (PgdA/CDA1 family)